MPAAKKTAAAKTEAKPDLTVTADEAFKVQYGGQLVEVAKGDEIEGAFAHYLNDTGAPVSKA